MRKEPQIFTSLQRQEVPIDLETLEDLESHAMRESAVKSSGLSTGEIEIQGYPFSVEIAETPRERAKGLSGRKYLPDGTGMLFRMDGGPASFHMRDTHVPLDVLYLDEDGLVIMKDHMLPHTGKSRCDGDVHEVLELPAGVCDELSVEVGDIIDTGVMSTLRKIVRETLIRSRRD